METAKEFLENQGWSKNDKGTFDFNGLCELLEKYKNSQIQDFNSISESVLKYMSNNHHPHCTLTATSTNVQVLEGVKSTGETFEYIKD